jgi:hypothetical protein
MPTVQSNIESFNPGQRVGTSFGQGIVKAISYIDSIIYVTLTSDTASLYLFHPEQVEVLKDECETDGNRRFGG